MFPDRIDSEHLFDLDITLEPGMAIGATPFGARSVIAVTGGSVSGPRITGTVLAHGADWLLSFAGGHNELDVRTTIETHDGARIYLRYAGVLRIPQEMLGRAISGDVDESAYYFRTTPRMECGDERYAWVNSTICVGHGRVGQNRVMYRVFAVK
jgi:hypothetical protein